MSILFGQPVKIFGSFAATDGSTFVLTGCSVEVFHVREGGETLVATLTPTLSTGNKWSVVWTPPESGAYKVRAEGLDGSTVAGVSRTRFVVED